MSAADTARYEVRVTKDYLVFAAGHFITFNGDQCERLHGHNYRLDVEAAGPLDENYYVLDFIALLEHCRAIVAELDHRMLLPMESKLIKLEWTETEVLARFRDRRWIFPASDCKLLPLANTTTELLAHWIGKQLFARLRYAGQPLPQLLRVRLEENFGQWAMCELSRM